MDHYTKGRATGLGYEFPGGTDGVGGKMWNSKGAVVPGLLVLNLGGGTWAGKGKDFIPGGSISCYLTWVVASK